MRTFYVFKIKKEISTLTKETPYNLFHTIENLYYLDTDTFGISFNLYSDIFDLFNTSYLNNRINNLFKNNNHYYYDGVTHSIDNKYRPEKTNLKVYRSHIYIKTDTIKPTLLFNYLMSDNLFVCDFKNKDYFWLDEFVKI